MSQRPPVFSLEGIDGSGKSTQQKLVGEHLKTQGIEIATPTSPSHNVLGEFIRKNVKVLDPLLRNKLFLLDIEYVGAALSDEPSCDAVLWDRHVDSFYASNPGMSFAEAAALTRDIALPRKTFYLDVDVETIMKLRTEVHDHHTIPEWLEMKARRYREIATMSPDRMLVIDGNLPREDITQIIAVTMLEQM